MAFEVGSVVAKFVADVSGFKAGVKQVQDDTNSLKGKFSDAGSAITKMASVFGIAMGAAGVVGFIKKSIDAFEESERVMAQTNAVIRSTGAAAGYTGEQVKVMAAEIQKATPISDEAAQAGMNMLLTFTNIGHDVFPQATQAMVDMSTAMNGGITPSAEELSNTAIQLGKALQDPILGVTALRRVGVNFNEQQQDTIKHLVNTNHLMDAQQLILKELATEFGGSAAAQLNTFSGRMQALQNRFNDTMELIGGGFTPALIYLTDALGMAEGGTNALAVPFQALGSIIIGLIFLAKSLGTAISTAIAAASAAISGDFTTAKTVITQGFTDIYMDGANAQTKLTQVWGAQTQKQTDFTKKAFDNQTAASSKASKKIQKDLEDETRKFKEETDKRKAKFEEDLADLIHAHQDKVKDLEDQLSDENRDFNQQIDDRKQSFSERLIDMKDAHQQKVDDIIAQIAEETAKGEQADQKKLDDLNARLIAENTAYDAQVAKDTQREQEEQDRLKRDHDEKVADTQKQLDNENAILKAHQAEVDAVKDKARVDDITRLQNQFKDENDAATKEHGRRMTEIAQRGDELGGTLGANINSGLGNQKEIINSTMSDIAKTSANTLATGIAEGARKAGEDLVSNFINSIIDKAKSAGAYLLKYGLNPNDAVFQAIGKLTNVNLPRFATGVNNFSGGLAMVGERGPELVNLPKGSGVTPNDKLGGTTVNLVIDMNGAIISDDFGAQRMAEKVGNEIIKKLQYNVRF